MITPHFVKPISADEKVKMPDFPEVFLPTVKEEQQQKKGNKKNSPPPSQPASPDQAEFVGPRGYQEPSK